MTTLVLAALLASPPALKLPALFTDHMVLQRESEVNVWGWGEPGSPVTVKPSWGQPVATKVQPDGSWRASIHTIGAGGPYTVTVTSGASLTLRDVMLGEVWVCSGQSNMEWPMSATDHAKEDIDSSANNKIRLFMVANKMSPKLEADCEGSWQVCSPQSVPNFSAVAYFFAKELTGRLRVPIGVIDTTWGGTEAELWTSEKGLLDLPDFAARIKGQAQAEADYKKQLAAWSQASRSKDPGWGKWQARDLNDSDWTPMSPLVPWSQTELKNWDGAVWFRGTVNLDEPDLISKSKLDLQEIDDNDETWYNGVLVGETDGVNVHRVYDIPDSALRPGRNVVTVRVMDTGGEGGWHEQPVQVPPGFAALPIKDWKYKKGVELKDLPPVPRNNNGQHSLLFNAMINPLVKYRIRGAIWYQGEANVGRAAQYSRLFPGMIKDWRKSWGIGDFPFYFVQIAPFNYGTDAAAELREAQFKTLSLKNTAMVVTTDVTENVADIHPRDKRSVGRRLALCARANAYDERTLVFSGPLYKGMKIEGGKIRVMFENAVGLQSVGGALREFQIAGDDRKFVTAKAEVSGQNVLVWADGVAKPVAVRMGWSSSPLPNLANGAGLPASPFRTDSWPGLTDNVRW
ncbi:MAG: 9-O-acetylesterase [Armatimonadetes bacterium]|nr:9-O-acetylesterase [Armatimonadota bacterium]